jgi:hypothetical protein
MICRATALGLSRCDQHPGAPAPAADQRPRQGHRDIGAAAPTSCPAAPSPEAGCSPRPTARSSPACCTNSPKISCGTSCSWYAPTRSRAGIATCSNYAMPRPARPNGADARPPSARSARWSCTSPVRTPHGGIAGSTVNSRPWHQGRRIHRLGDPPRARRPARAGTTQHDVGRLPSQPGRRTARVRLLRDPHPDRGTPVRLCRHRALHPAHPGPGRNRAPHRAVGRPGRTQSPHRPRGRGQQIQVLDPRPRLQVHAGLRRRARRRRTQDRQKRCTDAADELHHGALDSDLPTRTPGPNPDLEPEPPSTRAPRVRDLLQRASTAQNVGARRSAPPATRADQRARTHQPPGGPPPRPPRRNPSRVPTRRLTRPDN